MRRLPLRLAARPLPCPRPLRRSTPWLLLALALGAGLPASAQTPLDDKAFEDARAILGDPYCTTMPGATQGLEGAFERYLLVLWAPVAVLAPHVGVHADADETALSLRWSVQAPFGPTTSETVRRRRCAVTRFPHQGNRAVLSGALLLTEDPRWQLRGGYRYIHHAEDALFGFGAGLGGTVDFGEATRVGLSPELVLRFGRCCKPFYWTLVARYDAWFEGAARHGLMIDLGVTVY